VIFWKNKYEKLIESKSLLGLGIINNDLDTMIYETKKILDNDIQQFLTYISDAKGIPFSELLESKFLPIIEIIKK